LCAGPAGRLTPSQRGRAPNTPAVAPPPDPNLTALWCRLIAEELHRCGAERAVLCPGSRNSPLLHALHREFGAGCISHVDERSAGFIALGLAKRSGAAVVVCVTSGGALANLQPAAAEAFAARVPLLLVSADRPWEAHGSSSPQTMRQGGAFGHAVCDDLLLGEALAEDRALRSLRARLCWLVQRCRGERRPVHLNVPLRDPLSPLPDPQWSGGGASALAITGRLGGRPMVAVAERQPGEGALGVAAWRGLLGELPARPRGLIVAGPAPALSLGQATRLAQATGFPLLCDAPGGLRGGPGPVVATADALLTGPQGGLGADLIIQLGPLPLARATFEALDRQHCPWLVLCDAGINPDFLHRASAALVRPGDDDLATLAAATGSAPDDWRRQWVAAEEGARQALVAHMAVEPWGEVLAAHLAVSHRGFDLLHLASSMAVRHGNLHCLPDGRARTITANRGLNGIDGTLGTFLGELAAHQGNGLLLCGDLALLHDLPALCAARPAGSRGAIVVLNNDGGGIFDFLSVVHLPAYRQLVRTPHGMDFSHAAAQFGLDYHAVASRAELGAALDRAATGGGLALIECRVVGDTVARHRALIARMAGAVGGNPGAG
jgi:2-succinyl-5-enolpyruvyl-6-hydroxy-3-cyclohexene-1-carboxylate synthase